MKAIAVEKAGKRLRSAKEALERISRSPNFAEFERAWTDLLIHLNSMHQIFFVGSANLPKSDAWCAKIKGERRSDPLLQYLQQARNADEHGIEPLAKLEPGGMFIGGPGESFHLRSLRAVPDGLGGMRVEVETGAGQKPTIGFRAPYASLVPVTNRKVRYDPPKQHLGEIIDDPTPLKIAELAFAYHEHMLKEAAALVD